MVALWAACVQGTGGSGLPSEIQQQLFHIFPLMRIVFHFRADAHSYRTATGGRDGSFIENEPMANG